MTDNTDVAIFAAGIVITFIFGLGVLLWSRVSFANAMKKTDSNSESS